MTSVKELIRRQLDTSGNLLLRSSHLLDDEEFFYEPNAGASMAWTLLHLATLQDWAVNRVFLSLDPKFSREIREAFKGGRDFEENDAKHLTSKMDIEAKFSREQYETIIALDSFDEENWNVSTPSGCRFPTFGILWEHLATHNYWHLGAISVSHPRLTNAVLVAPRFYSVDPQEVA